MPNENRIFIKLPPAATPDELKTYFSEFGKITDVYIPLNPATQKAKVRPVSNSHCDQNIFKSGREFCAFILVS
jgi:RNA recognition motif-containing protein